MMKKIYTAANALEVEEIVALLNDQGITAYAKEEGCGEYLRIAWGTSIYGFNLYVEEEEEEKALEIIKRQKELQHTGKTEETPEPVMAGLPWYKNRVIVARIILGYLVIMGIVLFALSR